MNRLTTAYKKLALRGRFRTGYVVYCTRSVTGWLFCEFCFDLDSALHCAAVLHEKGFPENGIIISKTKFSCVKQPTIKKLFCQPRK